MNEGKTRICELLSAKELAKKMSLSPRTIFRLRSSRRFPLPVCIGGSVRWRLSDIELFLDCDCNMAEYKLRKEFEHER
ncbi:MAG TPA: helix-turn-helix domain-containing protein [Planctomycetes bacterium]|nr:helix-turn-helix domain-containing protein [Planctomycetota bacterium]